MSAPRFLLYSYKITRDDGRIQQPLVFLFYSPTGGNPSLSMAYTRVKTPFIAKLAGLEESKIFDFHSVDDLTTEWLEKSIISRYTR